jgi:putative tryptophan/tyrosine transport system substrate-binding protein
MPQIWYFDAFLVNGGFRVKRRQFITLLTGSAVGWPLVAHAQQPERVRRIGVLMNTAAEDPVGQTRIAAFLQELQRLGWSADHNVQIDMRWAAAEPDRIRRYAAELAALAPDVIVATAAQPLDRCSG